ncbi:hypothetical protein [Jiangella asiatica]|uniref:Uncharacterized protein n=1 Tax=Jiangella asiatica TaxID=2530372 RepID=A0A4R5DJU7_9ACTN|nr:hypothetical protein [Jiangella asiatica]TDE14269.1 hypothetical protein E1269_03695 [Jiangella asiatica]
MATHELSFDPRHPWYPVPNVPGAEWSVEVFTVDDVRLLDPRRTTFEGGSLLADGLTWPGAQRNVAGRVRADLMIAPGGDAVTWRIRAEADVPVKAIKLLFRGLPGGAEDGWWSPTTPRDVALTPRPDEPVLLRYPWPNWQTPWICQGEGPAVTLSTRDTEVRAKRFYTFLPPWSPSAVTEVVCDQLATRRTPDFEAPPIVLRTCADVAAVHADLAEHLEHVERSFGLADWEDRADVPDWARDIRLVVTLHGQHWTGYVFNTFDDMGRILEEVTRHVPGEHVLAYLPGWEGRYYWQYPIYRPGEDLGGADGFRRLTQTARRLGVHLMPMFGANGANVGRYPRWEDAAFRSAGDRYVVHVNHPDWDGDRTREDDQVFLNPGEPEYRAFLREQIGELVTSYDVAGVFLDTSACWFDDPRHELYAGYRALVGELREAHPGLLVCGEGWYDALLGLLPVNQTWLDVARPPRTPDLPYRYSRVLGHLNSGCPGQGSTGVHEGGFREPAKPLRVPGFVPSLGFVSDTLERYADDVAAFCREVGGREDGRQR